jgi:hypothetical protein
MFQQLLCYNCNISYNSVPGVDFTNHNFGLKSSGQTFIQESIKNETLFKISSDNRGLNACDGPREAMLIKFETF